MGSLSPFTDLSQVWIPDPDRLSIQVYFQHLPWHPGSVKLKLFKIKAISPLNPTSSNQQFSPTPSSDGLLTFSSSPWLVITRASWVPVSHIKPAASLPLPSVSSAMFHRHTLFLGHSTRYLHGFAVAHLCFPLQASPCFNPRQVSAGLISALGCALTGFSLHILECVYLINAEVASLAFQPLYNQVSIPSLLLKRSPPPPAAAPAAAALVMGDPWNLTAAAAAMWELQITQCTCTQMPSPFRIPAFPTRSDIKGH